MKVNEYLKSVTTDLHDSKLFEIQSRILELDNNFYTTFSVHKTLVDLERINYAKDVEIRVNKKIKEINEDYREFILHVSRSYKKKSITVWSFSDKTLTDVIGKEFNFNFNIKSYKDRARVKYSKEKLVRAMILALSFLFSKYQDVYDFQVKITFIKLIIDFFDYQSVNYTEAYNVYTQILNLELGIVANKINELGFKLDAPAKEKRERKPKTQLPTKEQFEYWISSGQYTLTEIKNSIAQQYKVSAKTVQRKLAEYGLTKYKYTTKNNLKG